MCNIKHIIRLVLTISNVILINQLQCDSILLHKHVLKLVNIFLQALDAYALAVENRSIPSNKFELHGPPLLFLFKHKFA
ncbi:hypothetical protein PRUPE_1G530200 [Prunus persica]|uniref:Uncharacterized protein n=1 Tax=Prunus persica TaxID=3760 RepID=A0A251RJF1_PRUPE|nr:hypothetical protein PRUPE_1G530200 [Prunus persica]